MYPAPRVRDGVDVQDVTDLTAGLIRDYRGALDSYEAGLWRPAASYARTIFEGIVKALLPESEKFDRNGRPLSLATLFERLATSRDLAQPIKNVGDVLREGGNLASHFEEGVEITPELATEVLDLLDSMMEYLFVIPRRVDRLKLLIAER
jgi:hypothetical protein